ncbi:diguanylate cyclase [Shewanella sp. Isolate13]|uniref:tetratricopeptide repeat-containing diguanylate cyclase n=1 Tax=Shewanella sp. Isolate13 TaxID=2908531 RepID=UPI001EFEAD51|nr:diguanylate cyclase [Shewanella sp. Isolate13]MCG9729644.1 diguanylate cyclase [Shewanella sp. Isolate13]
MEKFITFFIFLVLACSSVAVNSAEFSPLHTIEKLSNGQRILALLNDKTLDTNHKRHQLAQEIPQEQAQQSAYHAFAYYRILHDIEMSNGNPEAAELAISKMLTAGQRLNRVWLIAEAKMWQATFAVKQSRFKDGLALVDDAIRLSKAANFDHLTGRAFNTKGALYYFQDQYYVALEYYLNALDIFRSQPDDPYISKVLSNVAVIYVDLQEWDKAWDSNNEALAHIDEYGGSYEQFSAFNNNAAFILEQLGRVRESEPYLIAAQKNAELSGNLRVKVNTKTSWAHYYLSIAQYQLAVDIGRECVALASVNRYLLFESDCSRILAKALFNLGQVDDALVALVKSETLYSQIGTRAGLADTYNTYALVYEAQGDYKSALDYQRKANEEDKALLFDRRAKMSLELSKSYQEKYRQQELAVLKAENDAQDARLAEQKLREKLLFFIILVSVISISLLIWKRYGLENDNKNLQSSNRELYKQSNLDTLTGLYNRRYFLDYLAQQGQLPTSKDTRMCLAIIDIDHFKRVNDSYGHDIGDEVLVRVGQLIQSKIREDDLLIRWGGEEFILLLSWPAASCPQSAKVLLSYFERIRQAVADTIIEVQGAKLQLTVSFGVGLPLDARTLVDSWQLVLDGADKALYLAKRQGRNRVVLAQVAWEVTEDKS